MTKIVAYSSIEHLKNVPVCNKTVLVCIGHYGEFHKAETDKCDGWKNVYYLPFKVMETRGSFKEMDDQARFTADRIIDILKENPDFQRMIFRCTYGEIRSKTLAVALYQAYYLGGEDVLELNEIITGKFSSHEPSRMDTFQSRTSHIVADVVSDYLSMISPSKDN